MWRALVVFVLLLLATGVFALVTGGATSPQHAAPSPSSGTSSFGFALAAGAVALAATLLASRPRFRFRR